MGFLVGFLVGIGTTTHGWCARKNAAFYRVPGIEQMKSLYSNCTSGGGADEGVSYVLTPGTFISSKKEDIPSWERNNTETNPFWLSFNLIDWRGQSNWFSVACNWCLCNLNFVRNGTFRAMALPTDPRWTFSVLAIASCRSATHFAHNRNRMQIVSSNCQRYGNRHKNGKLPFALLCVPFHFI